MSTISPATAPAAGSTTATETSQVGTLIRSHRLRIGLTQRELADLSTISVRAIRDLEQGKARRPRTDTVRLIADALRLGPRARTALEAAAQQGRCTGSAGAALDSEPPAPPTALHGLTGREAETEVMVRELSAGSERLVNVVGLSGVGKTRLAVEVANRLYGAGQLPVLWYAFPGAARDYLAAADAGPAQQLVRAGVAHLFDPAPADDGSVLPELLGDRAVLLVLDGVPEQAPRFDRLTRLMRDCPGLRLLVTSEQPWQVPGERPFLLAPLEVPVAPAPGSGTDAVEGVAEVASVRLFLDHVRRVRPEFAPSAGDLAEVARICRRLDGHPMALAAAASWLAVCDLSTLSGSLDRDPGPLLDHLAGGDGGHRFQEALRRGLLRLTAGDRALLGALCAAPEGEFGLDEVVALTGRGLPECGRMVRDLLISGVIRPSHEAGRSRFRVLQLVRAFHPARPELPVRPGRAGRPGTDGAGSAALAAAAR